MKAVKKGSVKEVSYVVNDVEIQNRIKRIEKEIGDALEENKKKFLNAKWNELKLGENPVPPLPITFIEDFDSSFYAIPFAYNPLPISITEEILSSSYENITFAQVSMAISVIASTEPKSYTKSKEDYILKRKEYDLIYRIMTPLEEEATASNNRLEAKIKNKYDNTTWLPKKSQLHK